MAYKIRADGYVTGVIACEAEVVVSYSGADSSVSVSQFLLLRPSPKSRKADSLPSVCLQLIS
jgi:hypothetical protein